jgi:AraC family transcriptional activator of mtrCDE
MHAFDHLIALANLSGVLDLHCQLEREWSLHHPPLPTGQASYHLILHGECRLELPGLQTQRLRAGDIVLLPRSSVHVLAAGESSRQPHPALHKIHQPGRITQLRQGQGAGAFTMLCGRIHYSPQATLLAALPEVLVINPAAAASRERLDAIITLMRLEAEGEQLANQSVVDGLSVILFTLVLRHYCEQEQALSGVFAVLQNKRLAKVALALLNDLSHSWSVEHMAVIATMSRASFVRAFAITAGMAPAAWLAQLRMERAQKMLQQSAISIAEVALAVGYPTLSSFSRVFRQHIGEAPQHYRKRLNAPAADIN